MKYAQILRRQERMKNDVLDLIARQPARTMAVIHYALPHNPYMYDEKGGYTGPQNTCYELGNVPGYERNLLALDRFIGEVTTALRKAGRFEEAMLVLTSDHSFRYDPDRKNGKLTAPLSHVPLIVKLPRQSGSFDVRQQYTLGAASRLIDTGLTTEGSGPAFASRLLGDPAKLLARKP
jgi:membrane-anchored protein YejM (alkaline phosphatase superfamily)